MDFRLVLALWATAAAALPVLVVAGRGLDRSLLWSIRFGIALLYFTPFVITTDTIFPFIVGKALFTRGVIEIVFGMWVVLALRRPEFRPSKSWLTILFALFLAGNLIAALAGVSFTRSFWSNYERMQGVVDLAHWFALFAVMLSVIRGRRQWLIVFNILVGVGLVSALLGVAQRFDVRVMTVLVREARLTGTLGNATYVGAHMAMIAMIALGLLLDSLIRPKAKPEASDAPSTRSQAARSGRRTPRAMIPNAVLPDWIQRILDEPERRIVWPVIYLTIWGIFIPSIASGASLSTAFLGAAAATALVVLIQLSGRERLLYGVTAVLAVWIMAESGSRGAGAALAAGLIAAGFAYALWGGQRQLRLLSGGAAIALVAFGLLFLATRDSALLQRLADTNPLIDRVVSSGFTEQGRTVSARAALEAFADDPLTGYGPENFQVAFRRFQRADDYDTPPQNQDQTHNRPLEVLSGSGLVGFVPYVGLWGFLLFLAVRRIRQDPGTKILATFLAATLLAYLVHLIWLFETANAMLMFVTLAAWAGGAERAVAAQPETVPLPAATSERRRPPPDRRARRASPGATEPAWFSRRTLITFILPGAVAIAVLAALFGINARIQRAGYLVIRPAPIDEIESRLNTFAPLGTLGRISLAEAAIGRLGELDAASRSELVRVISSELEKAIAAEPESMGVRLAAARFFSQASRFDSGLLARAEEETRIALELGPHTHEAHVQVIELALQKKDLAAVKAGVAVWDREHPAMAGAFKQQVESLEAELTAPKP